LCVMSNQGIFGRFSDFVWGQKKAVNQTVSLRSRRIRQQRVDAGIRPTLGGRRMGVRNLLFIYIVAIGSMLSGASVMHVILQPDLTLPNLEEEEEEQQQRHQEESPAS